MIKVRTVFEKKGRAKYISHLDLNRFMMRVFKRSGLPIWYTEGFNPHPYITFALALSLGFESSCEVMDFNLTEGVTFGKVKKSLNDILPEGLKIISVSTPKHKPTDIEKAEYTIEYLTQQPMELFNEIENLMSKDEILVEKKSKKGIKTVDIKPNIEIINNQIENDKIILDMKLPAGTQVNFNPSLFTDALINNSTLQFETGQINRVAILCANGENFC